jgi:membrane protein
MGNKQNWFEKLQTRFDAFQQAHPLVGYPYAIIKKYSDDEAGYQAALIAYYGFLSFFPLLIVALAVIERFARDNSDLRETFITSVTSYFPAIGPTLTESINSPTSTGFVLLIGVLITFYGARGVADAVRHALNHVWAVPRHKRIGFPKSTLNSASMIIFGGIGLVVAATLSGYATGGDFNTIARAIMWFSGFSVLFFVFWAIFTFASSAKKRPFSNVPGALLLAAGVTILQAIGIYIITRQLKTQTGINAQFGVVLAMLFWMYLQAQLFLFAIELNCVRALGLWPRSLNNKPPTKADREAYAMYQQRETFHVDEPVKH